MCYFFIFPISFFWAFFTLLCLYAGTWFLHFLYHYPMPWFVKKSGICFAWRRVISNDPMRNGTFDDASDAYSEGTPSSFSRRTPVNTDSAASPVIGGIDGYGSLEEGMLFDDREAPAVGTSLALSKDEAMIQSFAYQYVSMSGLRWLTCQDVKTFEYSGAMRDGRPHGWGVWRDESFYGESLEGYAAPCSEWFVHCR